MPGCMCIVKTGGDKNVAKEMELSWKATLTNGATSYAGSYLQGAGDARPATIVIENDRVLPIQSGKIRPQGVQYCHLTVGYFQWTFAVVSCTGISRRHNLKPAVMFFAICTPFFGPILSDHI